MTLVKLKRPNVLFPNIVDEFWKDFAPTERATFAPPVNIREEEHTCWLEVSAPGYEKEAIHVSVEDDVLTITGTHSEEHEEQKNNYLTREFRTGSFKRSFNLTKQIDTEKINAKYENGILRVELPKEETAVRKPKEIKVA